MSKDLHQIYEANPITTVPTLALMYFDLSPYTPGSDAAITIDDFLTQVYSGVNSNVNGYTRQQYFAQQSLTDASPITWNLDTQQAAYVLLTSAVGATRQLQNPTNLRAGGSYTLIIQQSSTGNNALTYGTAYKFPFGSAPVLSTANNAVDILTFITDGTNMYGTSNFSFG